MSLETISSLSIKFKTFEDLQAYANSQYIALQKAFITIKQLETEVAHLKNLLETSTSNKIESVIIPTEQQICEMELSKLHKVTILRPLTLEETKRLDLLVKNLYLSKKGLDLEADFKRLPRNITAAELIQIASQPEPKENDSTS